MIMIVWLSVVRLSILSMMPVRDGAPMSWDKFKTSVIAVQPVDQGEKGKQKLPVNILQIVWHDANPKCNSKIFT